ncbi:MAG: cell division protein FtsZ [Mesoaciditoga sp.]|uniref:cell division protein FtsZ n=1 Tax=Athalassotoga sp. TaxID=2022597 RepID=UPI000CC8760F|nr:MAG: cell division protein FtsZ [Mesoaciditoga sp.]PMP79689.1 MAG: cell division protein FtsZ [Mesoaciditoga sp.]HEU24355.1 cell division protein FtsZ [Mesoaciditoga lauensis]
MPFEITEDTNKERKIKRVPVIKVMGVGGAGNNAITRMIEAGIKDVIFVAANTDLQVLEASQADVTIQLGAETTRGLGAGGYPEIGEKAAEESKSEIQEILEGTDLLFLTCGMGGGTGTGATPVIARIAKEMQILTVAIVTTPFYFEGNNRWRIATEGLKKLHSNVDTLIRISNNKLLEELPPETTIPEAFLKADETLHQGVKGISELITKRGYINLDFADVEAVMRNAGPAMLGIGIGKGQNRAEDAARMAMDSKLLEQPVKNASSIILNVSAPKNVTMKEMHAAASVIRQGCSEEADVKFGLIIDDTVPEDEMRVTLIATGFEEADKLLFTDSDIPAIYRSGLDDFLR